MRINGNEIRDSIKNALRDDFASCGKHHHLVVLSVGDDPVVKKFVAFKRAFAEHVGVGFSEKKFPTDVSFALLEKTIHDLNTDPSVTGIIVQLPLSPHLDTTKVLDLVLPSKDVDVLSSHAYQLFSDGSFDVLPPVVGAIAEICARYHVEIAGRTVVILGRGRLVGAPAEIWFRAQGGRVAVFDKMSEVDVMHAFLHDADIVVSGIGQAGYLKPEMLKEGVVLIDAGTSESRGVIVGDADPKCEEIARLFTPVPGGVGPLTVAMIFRNLVALGMV
jgi:methylenetetrahydrofolate dehydrogenase (NADP+) / methenyltetrahydrofolate cyclohydrolase